MRIAYFTAGTIGAGHLVRGLAVQAGLRRAGWQGQYRAFAPQREGLAGLPDSPERVAVDAPRAELADPRRAGETALARALFDFDPDLLLVDLFWAPLHHLLPRLRCPAWLLLRWVPPAWFGGPPGLAFDAGRFARRFVIEPFAPPLATERLNPIVLGDPAGCRPPGSLRRRLGLGEEQRLVAVVHGGQPGEVNRLVEAAGEPVALLADLHRGAALFPVAEWLGDADRILTGAGYNSFWEARWLGTYDRTEFFPFARPLDNQAWRASRCAGAPLAGNGADELARLVLAGG